MPSSKVLYIAPLLVLAAFLLSFASELTWLAYLISAAGTVICLAWSYSAVRFCAKGQALSDELNLANERYRLLTENLAAAVIIQESDGKVLYCSPYTEVLTGYSLPEIYGSRGEFLLNIVHDDDKERFRRALLVSASGEPFQFRYRICHKSGIEMWVETRTVPLSDDNGRASSSLSITLDITGTVRYQTQVEQKNRDLQDFAYMISHDLKAPLVTIKGMVSILKEDLKSALNADTSSSLDHISSAASRLEALVQGVLEYSKVNMLEGSLKPVDLNAVLKEVLNDLSAQRSEAGATIDISGSLPPVYGDYRMLYQVFSNLLGNAIKYRSKEREIRIEIFEKLSPRFNYALIAVKDNGVGIPADKQELIFRPFHRASNSGNNGSGVGLASVCKLLEKIGGSVCVESAPGLGATFIISIRRASGAPRREEAPAKGNGEVHPH